MKAHTNNCKEEIKKFGRELDSIITYTLNGSEVELGAEVLNSITPNFKSDLLKSCMKEIEIDSNIDIPLGTQINYKLGLLVGEEYEYIDYGDYIVYSSEKQEDTSSYKIVAYDYMLYSMIDYEHLKNGTFPMTVSQYIANLCNDLGLEFANNNQTFVNYNRLMQNDLYADLGYTYRDIFDELSQVTASTICINKNNQLEIRYVNDTNDTIDEYYLKDINVNFGEKYGPINSIVLSRAEDSDNVYLQDEESIEANGLCELKIKDNQIMSLNDRDEYLPDILNKLNGLEYYINDFTSTGICYYDVCDRYNVQIGDKTYSCIMFNDEVNVTHGLVENIYTDLPEQSETDYKKADKTDRRIKQAYILVDKQNQTIQSVVADTANMNDILNGVVTEQTNTNLRIDVISTNIDENGEVTSVRTTNGFTFDSNGLNISTSENDYNTQINNEGTYYRDGDTILGQTTKDGSKFKDMDLFGTYRYGKENIDDEPMFIGHLYTNENGEVGFGHFYNGGE